MSREVPMRMFSSLTERINVLREHRPECYCLSRHALAVPSFETREDFVFLYIYTLIVNHTTTYNTGASTYPIYENKKKRNNNNYYYYY